MASMDETPPVIQTPTKGSATTGIGVAAGLAIGFRDTSVAIS